MKLLIQKTAILLFALAGASCATSGGPTYLQVATSVASDKGSVVIYRWSSLKGAAWTHRVFLDGQHVADLRNGEFTRIAVTPGEHKLSLGTMKNTNYLVADLHVSAGASYFFEDHPGYNMYAPDRLLGVDQAIAEKRLQSGYTFHAPLASSQ
ncbi:DUF2846 domain-containing protein [Lysobacter fragariae]